MLCPEFSLKLVSLLFSLALVPRCLSSAGEGSSEKKGGIAGTETAGEEEEGNVSDPAAKSRRFLTFQVVFEDVFSPFPHHREQRQQQQKESEDTSPGIGQAERERMREQQRRERERVSEHG